MKKFFSYSELRTFNYSKDEYYKQYVQGIQSPPNQEMLTGTLIHETIANPQKNWLKELKEFGVSGKAVIPYRKVISKLTGQLKPKESEVTVIVKLDNEIMLHSIYDGLDKEKRELDEFKTTTNNDRWFQWTVDKDKQLSFYALVYNLTYHKYFREIRLHRINYATGNVKTFYTTRGPADIIQIAIEIKNTVSEIKSLGWWTQRKSRQDINNDNTLKLPI